MTGFPISGLRSVDLDTPDLSRAVDFYTQVWGLQLVERTLKAAWLRGSGRDHHVLALHLGEAPAIRCMTFRVVARSALERLARSVTAAGGRVVDRFEAGDPAGGQILAVEDLCGRCIHLVHGDDDRSPDRPVPGRVERLAHVNINSSDVDADARFFEQGLGFKLTDRSKLMAFVRTNSDHHSIVIAEAPAPTLNHVAFQQPTWEGVMRAAGRLVDHGFPIAWGVGRHGPGDNVFAYFLDPFGFVVEHTAEVLQVDDDYRVRGPDAWVWPPGRTDQWGVAPPKSEACKKAQLAIPFASAAEASRLS